MATPQRATVESISNTPTQSGNQRNRLFSAVIAFSRQLFAPMKSIISWGAWQRIRRVESTQAFLSPETQKYLRRLRRDANDSEVFFRAVLSEFIASDPSTCAARMLLERVAPLKERSRVCDKAEVYATVFLPDATFEIDASSDGTRAHLADVMFDVVRSVKRTLDKKFRTWPMFISHARIEQLQENAQRAIERYGNSQVSGKLATFHVKYQQLCDEYRICLSSQTDGNFWKYVEPVVAFVGENIGQRITNLAINDPLGIGGKVCGKVASELIKGFQTDAHELLYSFDVKVRDFTQELCDLEAKFDLTGFSEVDQCVSKMRDYHVAVIKGLENAALNGFSIKPILRGLHFRHAEFFNAELKPMAGRALSNLKREGLSDKSERNIREMFRLTN